MNKTNIGLVEYCKAQVGRPYWYGSFGQFGTLAFFKQKQGQYPKYYTHGYDSSHTTKKVHDCVGLIKGYLWCTSPQDGAPKYNALQDKSANGLRNACTVKGDIASIPETPGILVFKDGHVGVYIGGGEVIEARGRAYGVEKTRLTDRGWTSWGQCPYITYDTPKPVQPDVKEAWKAFKTAVEALPEYKTLTGLLED